MVEIDLSSAEPNACLERERGSEGVKMRRLLEGSSNT